VVPEHLIEMRLAELHHSRQTRHLLRAENPATGLDTTRTTMTHIYR
jgi:hypothetical protein